MSGAYKSGHGPSAQPPPLTLAEHLDAAQTGAQFGAVLHGLFRDLDRLRELEEEHKQ